MATNQARTALCVLFCIFLGLSLQQVNLKVTEPCKYLDPNSISCDDSNSCTGMIHFHEKQANDLFSRHQYKLDLTYTMTSNEIMYIKKDDLTVQLNSMMVGQKTYKDKAESTWLDYGFIRIPFMATPMALSKMYSQIPEKSYLFVPYIVDSSVTQTDIKILLREYFKTSALNTNSATTGTGTIITRVKNMPDTARGVVLVAPVMVMAESDISTAGYMPLTMGEDSQNGFPSGTESKENKDNQIFYTNCKIIMDRSSERIKDFSEEQEYVRLELPSSIVTSRSTSSSG